MVLSYAIGSMVLSYAVDIWVLMYAVGSLFLKNASRSVVFKYTQWLVWVRSRYPSPNIRRKNLGYGRYTNRIMRYAVRSLISGYNLI